jgi:hypothetical protein
MFNNRINNLKENNMQGNKKLKGDLLNKINF